MQRGPDRLGGVHAQSGGLPQGQQSEGVVELAAGEQDAAQRGVPGAGGRGELGRGQQLAAQVG